MKQEIEKKFDVPLTLPDAKIILGIGACAQRCGFEVGVWETVTRRFVYYDTPELNFYERGETVRRISGFDPSKVKGRYRYDYKTGTLDERFERELWWNKKLKNSDIAQRLALPEKYKNIDKNALANTTHTRAKLTMGEVLIHATIDYFDVQEGFQFRELELELRKGSKEHLNALDEAVMNIMNLKHENRQKYTRIIDTIRKKEREEQREKQNSKERRASEPPKEISRAPRQLSSSPSEECSYRYNYTPLTIREVEQLNYEWERDNSTAHEDNG